MSTTSTVQFPPKWKEELICTMEGRRFVIELTMGTNGVIPLGHDKSRA